MNSINRHWRRFTLGADEILIGHHAGNSDPSRVFVKRDGIGAETEDVDWNQDGDGGVRAAIKRCQDRLDVTEAANVESEGGDE